MLPCSRASWVAQASGGLLDVDWRTSNPLDQEIWLVEALDVTDTVVSNITIFSTPLTPPNEEGRLTTWGFDRPSADIAKVRISFIGSSTHHQSDFAHMTG